jgi:CDGSH-type Zn-finger protein
MGSDGDKTEKKPRIKVTKNGPYIVTGSVPLIKMVIDADEDGYPYQWREVEKYPQKKSYALCRCGGSKKKPYCDAEHTKNGFDGTETAGYAEFMENVKMYDGPELKLFDNKPFCVGSGFCTRDGNIWNLTTHSDTPEYREIAMQEAADCPSGRLVLWDKQGILIEPDFEPSIVVTEDQHGVLGPIWVRGGIIIESVEGMEYEVRNRVTLCVCGGSDNKPFCDGDHTDSHAPEVHE